MRRARSAYAKMGFLAALLIAGVPATGASAQRTKVSLPGASAIELVGGSWVSSAGDVNGDGVADVLVSVGDRGSPVDPSEANKVFVVFGDPQMGRVELNSLGERGFVISSATPGDMGSVTSAAGDVNGDGLDDIVVGASDQGGGTAYVVFGKTDTLPVNLLLFHLNAHGTSGFKIDGEGGLAGRTVDGAGDVNGDGLSDVIIGAPFRGASYVVFGKADSLPVSLSLMGTPVVGAAGFKIETPAPDWDRGYHVAGIGDFNGDGTPDVAVGRSNRGGPAKACCGAWVVFGKPDGDTVDVRNLGGKGIWIKNSAYVAGAGDINGDGLSDLLQSNGVRFGTRSTRAQNASIGGKGGVVFSPALYTFSAADGGEDANGDGLDDVVFGAEIEDRAGPDSGSSYLLAGRKRWSPRFNLARTASLRIDGPGPDTYSGFDVALLGDINGDGRGEIAISVFSPPPHGTIHIVWGRS